MTEIEQLREIIKYLEEQTPLTAKLGRFMFQTRLNEVEFYKANAEKLLKLYEDHPEIQDLIDGKAWIAPNEPTEAMLGAMYNMPTRHDAYLAMRKASEK